MAESDLLRKRLYFQSAHRGTKENDIILTRFASARLGGMDDAQMRLYDRFLNELDPDIYHWLVRGGDDYPDEYKTLIADIRGAMNT